MKILFLHPYGSKLGDWNHRIKRQIELMDERCELKVFGYHVKADIGIDNAWISKVKNLIDEFKPDILYISGYLLAHKCLKWHKNIVYDMGAYKTRNILLNYYYDNYPEMLKASDRELIDKVNWAYHAEDFKKEDEVIKKAKAVIIWEGKEAELVNRLHGKRDNLHEISMMFYNIPEPIPWEDKQDKVIAIASKWSDKGKNASLLYKIAGKIPIRIIGHNGKDERFIKHDELMDIMNQHKVVFCPYICGGIGIVNEALKLGCNVIIGDWYPFGKYVNKNLVTASKNVNNTLQLALARSYKCNTLPSEEEQINKIMNICKSIIN